MHIFNRAIQWVRKNSIDNKGITVTSKQKIIYPEVTGYYIPTLLEWGERQLAVSYAKYLCDIHKIGVLCVQYPSLPFHLI